MATLILQAIGQNAALSETTILVSPHGKEFKTGFWTPHRGRDSRYWNPDFCYSWILDSNCWRNPDSLSCFPNSGFHEQKFPWFRHQRATYTLYAAINVLKFMPLKDVIYKRLIVAVVSWCPPSYRNYFHVFVTHAVSTGFKHRRRNVIRFKGWKWNRLKWK